jgi:N-acetylglutamate synthase
MVSWPEVGTRVTVRYRRPAGSAPPLTDAVGHLLAVGPVVRVRTKTGAIVEFAPADVVALRVLTDAPVRTSEIRALEHAAAVPGPGAERAWLEGWLLRAGPGAGLAANSAVPLDISAHIGAVPGIIAWYERRGLIPRLAIPDRLLRLPPGATAEHTERVLVRDVSSGPEPDPSITLSPDDAWPQSEVVFGTHRDGAAARATLTDAPDGTRWVGLSEIRAGDGQAGAALCEALLSWGAGRGATRGYLVADDTGATDRADSLGFQLHHRRRYVRAQATDTV